MKLALMMMAMLGMVTYSVNELFDTARNAANDVAALYAAAGEIDHFAGKKQRAKQQKTFDDKVERIAALANDYSRPQDFDKNKR